MRSLLTNFVDNIVGKVPLGIKRSSKWQTVRKHFLEQNPYCAVCESTKQLEAHHIIPFHLDPKLELDINNLITLCESKKYGINCHLLIGHLGNYKTSNQNCKVDAEVMNMKLKTTVLKDK